MFLVLVKTHTSRHSFVAPILAAPLLIDTRRSTVGPGTREDMHVRSARVGGEVLRVVACRVGVAGAHGEYFALLLSVEKYTATAPAVFAAPDPSSCCTQHLRHWSSYLQLRLTDRVPHVQQQFVILTANDIMNVLKIKFNCRCGQGTSHHVDSWLASPTIFNPSSRRLPLCQTSIRGPRDVEPSRRRDLLQERFEALEDSLATLAFGSDAVKSV